MLRYLYITQNRCVIILVGFRSAIMVSWKQAAKLSATWGAIVGAVSIIINALSFSVISMILISLLVFLSVIVPILIGFVVNRRNTNNSRIETKPAFVNGAASGVVYAVVMTAILLFFIVMNFGVAAIFQGDLELIVDGILVILATIFLGLPVLAIIGIIAGGIGGAIYSFIKK